jgi:hypothetical protein
MAAAPFPNPSSRAWRDYDFFGRLRVRILVSIAAMVGWLSATLLFLAFWASHFSLLQDIVVVIVSLLVLAGVLCGAWISYGLHFVDHWGD